MTLWYIRDNHTTASLPLDVGAAMSRLLEVFMAPGGRYGALMATRGPMLYKPMFSADDWHEFEPSARAWLTAALAPTAADIEYESWISQLTT